MSSIRCHTVPEFYLNYFLATGESCLWIYDKKDLAVRQQLPKDTTVIGDYYLSPPDQDGKKDARMEQFLSHFEGRAKPIIDSWIKNPSDIDDKEFSVIAMFLSYIHSRAPREVERAKEVYRAGLDVAIDKMKGISQDPEELRKYYQEYCDAHKGQKVLTYEQCAEFMANPTKNVKLNINEKSAIGTSFRFSDKVYEHLMQMHWSIRYVKDNHFFVTNDAPMNIFVKMGNESAIFGGGLALPNVQISFPLSPNVCLWISRKPAPKFERMRADFVTEINRRSAAMAERFVISPYRSNNVQRMVKEFAPLYGKPKLDADIIRRGFKL